MTSKLAQGINLTAQPIAVLKADKAPENAVQFKDNTAGCMVGALAAVAGGKTYAFTEETTGCPGARAGLGFRSMPGGPAADFLSTGTPDHAGLYLKKTCDLARIHAAGMPTFHPAPCLVMKPLNELAEGETPVSIIFVVNPDQLSGLVTMATFDRPDREAVKVPFGSGCAQSVLFTMCDSEAGGDLCTIGLTDPSARVHFDSNLLTFSIPWKRFLEMEANVDESFLTKSPAWSKVKERL